MELQTVIATVFRRYDIVLEHPDKEVRCVLLSNVFTVVANHFFQIEVCEGFLRKYRDCCVGIKRRGL